MAEPGPALQECATCGTLIDVTEEQPLALRHCPNCGAAMRVRRSFHHYELQEVLGAGGVGAVYRALDRNLHRPVALKLLRQEHSQNPELIESFTREAAITASINHPNVVKVYTTGTDHGIFYIAMELVDQGSLDDLMELQGKIGEAQALEVGIQIAEGLQAAQQRGLIHRDVKPGNILFADAHHAKIVDFGLAVLQHGLAHQEGDAVWGTPYYVAPEKLERTPREDFRSDLYSLGATLFHAIAGRPPFDVDTDSMVALRQIKSQIVRIQSFAPTISTATAYVINKTLERDPDERFASYADLIESLKYAHARLLTDADRGAPDREAPRSTAWITLTTAALVVAGGLAFDRFRSRPATKDEDPVLAASRDSLPDYDAIYGRAREQIAAGQFAEAAAALRSLESGRPAPPPRRNWIALHAALAHFLAEQPAEARQDLEKIIARGLDTPHPNEQRQALFFLRCAELAANDAPSPPTAAAEFSGENYEAFAWLLLGMKDWSRGAFAEGVSLLAKFAALTTDDATHWLAPYQALASSRVAQWSLLSEAAAAQSADEPAALQKALEAVKGTAAKAAPGGRLSDHLATLTKTLEQKLTTLEEARMRREQELDDADVKVLGAALTQTGPALAAFRFGEARLQLAGVTLATEKRKVELDGWRRRAEWLEAFKRWLIADINTHRYALPLKRRNGSDIPDGLGKASDARAEMVTRYGDVPVNWSDISVESLSTVAQAFLRTSPPETVADRRWWLGVFLHTFGRRADALPFLKEAAEAKAEYQAFLPLFPET